MRILLCVYLLYIPLSIRRIRAFFFPEEVKKIQKFGAQKNLGFNYLGFGFRFCFLFFNTKERALFTS